MRAASTFRDGPRDECGVFGVYAPESDVARLAYFALYALQHRGQESAGIATCDDGHIMTAARPRPRVAGLRRAEAARARRRHGASATCATRPPARAAWENAQPVYRSDRRQLALAHNGNLINAVELHAELREQGVRFRSTSDSEIIAALLSTHQAERDRGRGRGRDAAARGRVLDRRDDQGRGGRRSATRPALRPLALGQLGDRYCVASESCAFDIIGAKLLREVQPGELVSLGERGIETRQVVESERPRAFCVFEHIYFARPDSMLEGRHAAGRRAARWARSSRARRRSRPTS